MVVYTAEGGTAGAGWGIGGICIDGTWTVNGHFEGKTKNEPKIGDTLVFVFDIDEIKREATGDINVNFYNGFSVVESIITWPSTEYNLPTPTPTPYLLPIDQTNFPDTAFRFFVRQNLDHDTDDYLSKRELQDVKTISIDALSVYNLDGIEYFTNLSVLDIHGYGELTLDLTKCPALTTLNLYGISLNSLDLSPCPNLLELTLRGCNIRSGKLKATAKLRYLKIEYMDISELDLTEDMGLETLNLYDVYGLNNLHLEKNQKLDALLLYYTSKPQIASLDVSNNRQLSYLYISRAVNVIGVSEEVVIDWYD